MIRPPTVPLQYLGTAISKLSGLPITTSGFLFIYSPRQASLASLGDWKDSDLAFPVPHVIGVLEELDLLARIPMALIIHFVQ